MTDHAERTKFYKQEALRATQRAAIYLAAMREAAEQKPSGEQVDLMHFYTAAIAVEKEIAESHSHLATLHASRPFVAYKNKAQEEARKARYEPGKARRMQNEAEALRDKAEKAYNLIRWN